MTITPDKARELLNTARQEAGDGQRPVTVAAKYAPLVEATPALAELVANMHYEYDYQVLFMPDWVSAGERFATIESARQVVSDRRRGSAPTRIVRRLVSDPEVAE